MADEIGIILRLKQARQFISGTKDAAKAVDKLGDEAKKTGQEAAKASTQTTRLSKGNGELRRSSMLGAGGLRKLAMQAGGVAAAYMSIAGAKNAINVTTNLAKATLGLTRNLGLTNEQASQLAGVAQVRGIAMNSLNLGLTTMSKRFEDALTGGDKTMDMFKQLGITTEQVRGVQGDFMGMMNLVADGFGRMEGGTKRQALAQQLLGRGYQTLLPLFKEGSGTLNDQLELAKKYGVTLGTNTVENMAKLIGAQRELKYAQLGLQVQFTTEIAPALMDFAKLLIMAAGGVKLLIAPLGLLGGAVEFFGDHATTTKILVGALTIGFGIWATATLYLWAAQKLHGMQTRYNTKQLKIQQVWTSLVAAKTRVLAGATWLLNVALRANPLVLVITLLALAAVGFYFLYTKVEWFRDGVAATWDWIKGHWPLLTIILLGPIGLAIVGIIRHWDKLKGAATATVGWVIDKFWSVVNFLTGLPGMVGSAARSIGSAIKDGVLSGLSGFANILYETITSPVRFIAQGILDKWPDVWGMPGPPGFLKDLAHFGEGGIPGLAMGGTILSPGWAVVGERGPELSYMPAGASVVPGRGAGIPQPAGVAPLGADSLPLPPITIVTELKLDRKVLGRAVTRYNRDEDARS